MILWFVVFTLAVLAVIFWGAFIVAALVLLFRLVVWLIVASVQLGLMLFGAAAWLVMFPFAPGRAMAALRREEYRPTIRRDPALTSPGLPGVKIYRARPR